MQFTWRVIFITFICVSLSRKRWIEPCADENFLYEKFLYRRTVNRTRPSPLARPCWISTNALNAFYRNVQVISKTKKNWSDSHCTWFVMKIHCLAKAPGEICPNLAVVQGQSSNKWNTHYIQNSEDMLRKSIHKSFTYLIDSNYIICCEAETLQAKSAPHCSRKHAWHSFNRFRRRFPITSQKTQQTVVHTPFGVVEFLLSLPNHVQ